MVQKMVEAEGESPERKRRPQVMALLACLLRKTASRRTFGEIRPPTKRKDYAERNGTRQHQGEHRGLAQRRVMIAATAEPRQRAASGRDLWKLPNRTRRF